MVIFRVRYMYGYFIVILLVILLTHSIFFLFLFLFIEVAVCFLPKQTGMCQSNFPRYYFDQKTKKCVKFIYGGCGGNQNNFVTKKECIYKCASKYELGL